MKYRKKPVVVEAWKFTREALADVDSWVRKYSNVITLISQYGGEVLYIEIETLEGIMRAELGDYIIKGVEGEFYPCKPDIFKKTYEALEDVGEFVDEDNGYHRVNGFDLPFINTDHHKEG